MSVLIKGMEMPHENSERCFILRFYPNGHICDERGNVYQAIPVPDHGRLIDADALLMRINYEVMEAYMDGVCYGVHPSQEYLDLLGEIIDDAPTIIPAEENNNDR